MKRQQSERFGHKIIKDLGDERRSKKIINFIEEWNKIPHDVNQLIYEPYEPYYPIPTMGFEPFRLFH